jgi:threonine synthase
MNGRDMSYQAVMARKNEIMKSSMGMDYTDYIFSQVAFDYERMMADTGYSMEEIIRIQNETKVGNTPLYELRNLTAAVRRISAPGKGARILVKDEAINASGSFKARRASISVYQAARLGYKGVVAATSGNYGAAVASQASQRNLT